MDGAPASSSRHHTRHRTVEKIENMLYATGHGHLGLTYSATTARLIADLLTETIPPLDMFPYRVDRF